MIDTGEGIDISGISDKPLVKRLKKLFRSLRLKESATGAYLLPPKNVPTLDIVGPLLLASSELTDDKNVKSVSPDREELPSSNFDVQNKDKDDTMAEGPKIVGWKMNLLKEGNTCGSHVILLQIISIQFSLHTC